MKSIQVAFVCLRARKTSCFTSSWLSKLILCSRLAVVTQRIVCGIPQRKWRRNIFVELFMFWFLFLVLLMHQNARNLWIAWSKLESAKETVIYRPSRIWITNKESSRSLSLRYLVLSRLLFQTAWVSKIQLSHDGK